MLLYVTIEHNYLIVQKSFGLRFEFRKMSLCVKVYPFLMNQNKSIAYGNYDL